MTTKISIIAAVAENNVIGKNNELIWYLPADLKHFKNLTTGHHIIMGRKTFESIGKPLPNRTSIIVTSQKDYAIEGCLTANSLEEAIKKAENDNEVFIIGGGAIYKQAISIADKLYITKVYHKFDGDVTFPEINYDLWALKDEVSFEPDEKNKYSYSFCEYIKK